MYTHYKIYIRLYTCVFIHVYFYTKFLCRDRCGIMIYIYIYTGMYSTELIILVRVRFQLDILQTDHA